LRETSCFFGEKMQGQKAIEQIMLEFTKLTQSEKAEIINILLEHMATEIKRQIPHEA
jgi:hypothetical protein|tara:strand:+ start:1518 stop:1688 length:171 start_codon:yes stop_codon:yes gene_type:complete